MRGAPQLCFLRGQRRRVLSGGPLFFLCQVVKAVDPCTVRHWRATTMSIKTMITPAQSALAAAVAAQSPFTPKSCVTNSFVKTPRARIIIEQTAGHIYTSAGNASAGIAKSALVGTQGHQQGVTDKK
ncbi:hypothetical protein TRIUR3_14456 [Triticum urartu]|uniref:Uncharacterized protein n=1 Tax=Triticum urartu TaxID=4572 RepID=M8A7F2_TRIUA|nr:hypothetical protein TRIUR3_14456 [Triticum urartu]